MHMCACTGNKLKELISSCARPPGPLQLQLHVWRRVHTWRIAQYVLLLPSAGSNILRPSVPSSPGSNSFNPWFEYRWLKLLGQKACKLHACSWSAWQIHVCRMLTRSTPSSDAGPTHGSLSFLEELGHFEPSVI